MTKQISVESNLLIAESNGKSIAELMDTLAAPAKLAEIAECASSAKTEWDPKTILEIDRSAPKPMSSLSFRACLPASGGTRNLFK